MALTAAQIASNAQVQSQYPNLSAYPGLLSAIENQESGGDLGASSDTSSAAGPFQFLTGTAAQYGLTTGPTGSVYDQLASSQAAAQYLSNEVTQTGSVAGAVSAYSGGSYNYNQLATAQGGYLGDGALPVGVDDFGNPVYANPQTTVGAATGGMGQGTGAVAGWAAYLGELAKRVGVGGLGLGLIFIALFWLFAGAAIHEWKAAGKPIIA